MAPSSDVSRSGDEIAARAASTARLSPRATPMPMSAEPASRMIVRTSAKSRLMRPGTVMRSVMPCTPWRRMSSTMRNASVTGVERSTTCSRRSFSMTISVSTLSRSDWIPCSAWSARSFPSKRERPRHDADRERAELAPDLRDDGCAARSGAAALAGRDEDHVRALERFLELVAALLGRGEPDPRVGAGAEAARRLRADVDLLVGLGHEERLRVRVHGDELDARDSGLDHARDRVRAAAADADDLDDGEIAP